MAVDERVHSDAGPDFDPFQPAFLADPYPTFGRLRDQHPVFYAPALDYWVLSRYQDVRAALRDTAHYSAANALSPIAPVCPRAPPTRPSPPAPGGSPTWRSRRGGWRRWRGSSEASSNGSSRSGCTLAGPTS